jgi:hypothetical protein
MLRRYLLGAVLLCIAIGAIAWVLTWPPLPPTTTSPGVSRTFWRRESPAELAFSYQLRANIAGWILGMQDGNTYRFYSEQSHGGAWSCHTTKSLSITLIPTSGGGTRVSMIVTEYRSCPDPSP